MKYNVLVASILLASIIPINASNYTTIIIEFNIDADEAIKMLDNYDLEPVKRLEYTFNGYIVKIKAEQIERLKEESIVKNIFYDEPIKIKKNEQSNLELIGIDDYVRYNGINVTGKGVTVALIDTGVDYTHNDLKEVKGYDFLDKDNDPRDVDGHGTMVAGIIAADGAIRGVAPDVEIIAYRIASGDRYISTSEMITAIEKAAEDQADILNISIGLDHINEGIDRAINNLVDKGIIVVVAAGNDGESGFETIKSPGSAMKAITVGATLNNIQEPLFATLKVIDHEELVFHPIPMEDTVYASEPIRSSIKPRVYS
jgi:minor extracellular serine protease Vpr